MMLFFHLFKAQQSFTNLTRGQGLISLSNNTKIFEVYSESVNNFKDRYYLVSPLIEVAHANLYNIDFESPYQCSVKNSISSCAIVISWKMVSLMSIGLMTYPKKKR